MSIDLSDDLKITLKDVMALKYRVILSGLNSWKTSYNIPFAFAVFVASRLVRT
ncbi:MAG: hypothetical protein MHPDNHAH_01999 [Anaerolineales bacterium]|nr:hypothetical protein [Anaerolineales bacterium]